MANSDWTKEERERATQQIHIRRIVKWTEHLELSAVAAHNSYVEEIQMELNRLQEEVGEAREMLRNIENRLYPEWPISQDIVAWLSRNK